MTRPGEYDRRLLERELADPYPEPTLFGDDADCDHLWQQFVDTRGRYQWCPRCGVIEPVGPQKPALERKATR